MAGPTFDGFILERSHWYIEFWWTVGLQGLVLCLVFLFLDETSFDRDAPGPYGKLTQEDSWMSRRLKLFFPGYEVVRGVNYHQLVSEQ